jgi:hypothetical protein
LAWKIFLTVDGHLVMMMIKAIAQPTKSSEEIYQTTMTYWLFQGSPKYYRSKQATK